MTDSHSRDPLATQTADIAPATKPETPASSISTPTTTQTRIRLTEARRRDIVLTRVLLEGRKLVLERANEGLVLARQGRRPLGEILREKNYVTGADLEWALRETDRVLRDEPSGGVTGTFGGWTLVRHGDEILIEDRAGIRQFGRYEILGEIARGGMGVVYRARQQGLDRLIALKVLIAGEHGTLEQIRRFQREAQTAASLSHPNIVPIFDVGEEKGEPYFTMEYVPGVSLSGLLKEGRPATKRALEIMRDLALAMDYAHGHGIIHRDLKPSNVLFDRAGTPKITDFGLAKEMGEQTLLTHSGQVLGTPAYMSPEQALGEHHLVDTQSDVYALGAMFYELLAGKRAFAGRTFAELMNDILHEEPVPLVRIVPGIHPDLQKIAMKAMAKEKSRRYRTARELADDIQNFLDGRVVAAQAPSLLYRAKKWVARRKLVVGLLGVSLLAVLGVAGILGQSLLEERRRVAEAEERERERERAQAEAYEANRRARPHFDRGEILFKDDKFDLALEEYGRAVEIDPGFDRAYIGLGHMYQKLGRLEESLDQFDRAVEAAPASITGYNERAALLARMGRFEEAIRDYKHVLDREPENAEFHFNLGLAYIDAGDLAAAREHLALAIEERPDFPQAHYYLGIIAFKEGNLDEARAAYARASALDEGHVEARYQLGRVLAALGRPLEALGEFDLLLARSETPGAEPLTRDLLRKTLSRRGLARLALDRLAEALADFEGVRAIDPEYSPPDDRELGLGVRQGRARALVGLSRLPEAILAYGELVREESDDETSRREWVEALLAAGQIEEARRAVDGFSSVGDPASREALLARARLALAERRFSDAAEFARRARELPSGDSKARLYLAFAAAGEGNSGEAQTLFAELVREDAERTVRSVREWARELARDPRHLAGAAEWARRAAESAPGDTRALGDWVELANARRLAEGTEEVTDEVALAAARLLEIEPRSVGALQLLAGHEFARTAYGEALRHISAAIEISPAEGASYLLRARIRHRIALDTSEPGLDLAALGDMATAANLIPGDIEVVFELAEAYYDLGLGEDARALFARVLEAEPDHLGARLYRALDRAGAGDDKAALDDLDWILARAAGNVDALLTRAQILARTGDKDGAIRDLEAVLALSPGEKTATELLARLKER